MFIVVAFYILLDGCWFIVIECLMHSNAALHPRLDLMFDFELCHLLIFYCSSISPVGRVGLCDHRSRCLQICLAKLVESAAISTSRIRPSAASIFADWVAILSLELQTIASPPLVALIIATFSKALVRCINIGKSCRICHMQRQKQCLSSSGRV